MNFSRFLDIQSWWEVPSIAYFCSLFRNAFSLLDFDIEDLEEALLTDGTEDSASSLLTELIVRLLNGCLGNNEISAFNFQMYLRRLFRQKCQEKGKSNPFDNDINFQFLPLRTKVEILYSLCDFRLEIEDIYDLFRNLEAESLRVEPLGWDENDSAYWYFYGTRLYREDIVKRQKGKNKKRKKQNKKGALFNGDDSVNGQHGSKRVWQVVCFNESDWTHLTDKLNVANSKVEKELYESLLHDFIPEIPRLLQQKELLQRTRLLGQVPRRTSSRVLQKIKQKEEKEEEDKKLYVSEAGHSKETASAARENRARRRNQLRSKSSSSDSSDSSTERKVMPQTITKPLRAKKSKISMATQKGEPPPKPVVRTGRKTNNSLSAATGQIVIPDNDEPVNSTRRKLKTSQIQTDEDVQTDMYKVLQQLTLHENAWPFMDPVDEEFAPNYYAVIRRPMNLHKMEERLDKGYYSDFSMFKADFKLIVNNCRLYNGQENEYTTMVDSLQVAFDRLTEKYIHRPSSSDEEIAVEYQLPTPSRKHKLKINESPSKRKKLKSNSEGEPKANSADKKRGDDDNKPEIATKSKTDTSRNKKGGEPEEEPEHESEKTASETAVNKSKESRKNKHDKKKRRGHHRHGKHHKKNSHKSNHESKRHSKKQKHGKNKKSKQKKKKNKHHDADPPEILKRSVSQESLESSNRGRSASPLPSIHTPSPSPTGIVKPETRTAASSRQYFTNAKFLEDKCGKIIEKRRHAGKDAWESLFDFRDSSDLDEPKTTVQEPEVDKNQKLRETIERLRASSQKHKDASLFTCLFSPRTTGERLRRLHREDRAAASANNTLPSIPPSSDDDDDDDDDGDDDDDDDANDEEESSEEEADSSSILPIKETPAKDGKRSTAKNVCASEALEQAVKDISKWLDDAPKGSAVSSPNDSPAQTISTEDQENSRMDDESSQGEKPHISRKELPRKRPSSREPKTLKRREVQRTIDRLQPGKSKGNLLTNNNKNIDKTEDTTPAGPMNKTRDSAKIEESSPKLSLGSVLPTVEFTLGNDHNFNKDEAKIVLPKETKDVVELAKEVKILEEPIEMKPELKIEIPTKKDAEVETEPIDIMKPCQEKATPNLSAWFKAFGAPKTTSSTATTNNIKKKIEETVTEEKPAQQTNTENKPSPIKPTIKNDSLIDPNSPNPEGGDSPLPSVSVTPRQRRTSTGSTISERSSFSQDLDSPRHQMSHSSPLLRSPASPRTDDFQKITYPIINGTVRAGFYQDTTSQKSSPEKSCSPRDAPQSPYSLYSQHVYASNSNSSTPNYFVDHNKSPLPTYGQNAPPYYDTSKAPVVSKPARVHDDYTALGPDSFQQNPYNGPFSPAPSPFPPTQSNYSQPQVSPQPELPLPQTGHDVQLLSDIKTSLFPVKKRMYNEPEDSINLPKMPDKDLVQSTPVKNDYSKITENIHTTTSMISTKPTENIATIVNDKTDLLKNNECDKNELLDYSEREISEKRDNVSYETHDLTLEHKNEIPYVDLTKPINTIKKDDFDILNMGYMNIEDRKLNDSPDVEFVGETKCDIPTQHTQHKGYEIEAIAINLGMNNQPLPKSIGKPVFSMVASNIPPAHIHERPHTEIHLNQTIPHAHHNQYDSLPTGQTNNFSLNDIELGTKKLYSCNNTPTPTALDYGNWKVNQVRKPELLPSDYSTNSYAITNGAKLRAPETPSPAAINYNKNFQHQQYNNYNNVSRSSLSRPQEAHQNLSTELIIPNPRSHLKDDPINISTPIVDNNTMSKAIEPHAKTLKPDKHIQNHPLVSSIPYKTPYSAHSSIPLDTLRNLPNMSQMLERYTNDERYLASFANSTSTMYHDKTFQMAQMFNKTMSSDVHQPNTPISIYSQPQIPVVNIVNKDNSIYKNSMTMASPQIDAKKHKRKRSSDTKLQSSPQIGLTYHPSTSSDALTSVKSNMMPFNFGTSTNMALSNMYGDNSGFSIEGFRNSTNQLMAANYVAAAVAHQHRTNDTSTEKLVKPAHQSSNHTTSYPFIGHSQVRSAYPFVSGEPSSPLYQQYLARYQEELQRQTGAQIMGLYPAAYTTPLGVRQPYDAINRPSWM